ncbi:MAG: histidine kinase dimerization/phospho-acceptor domain-containing protein, partial [Qipengyuania sp.]
MYFDDRLATVLRHRATGERAARTQYRQLLDLLGEGREGRDESLEAAAFLRLDALSEMVPMRERARIVGESGARIRNAALVRWFGEAEPDVAAAALARASLPADAWAEIIPELPVRARGFLRHRRDLPRAAVDILDRLGVRDRALPEPEISHDPFNLPPIPLPLELEIEDAIETGEEHESKRESLPQPPAPDPVAAAPTYSGAPKDRRIGEIVRRIEAFSKARGVRDGETFAAGDAPHLPLDEYDREPHRKAVQAFSFGTDTRGRLDWADVEVAPMVLGFDVARLPGVAGATNALPSAFANRQPVREAQVRLDGAHSIAGSWIIDASPRFAPNDGRFTGYLGRFRRLRAESTSSNASSEADRIRQLLHELRTPVNAIQGFAEVIQQQIFGATPHEYRALAASIAGDSARMLAGFDELDRLAGLESGAFELDRGVSDLAAIARKLVGQLQTVLN